MRYLGIDFGTKKIGVALSDEAGQMGFPHSVLPVTPALVEDLAAFAKKEGVGAVVFGESLNLSGEENPVAAKARTFAAQLSEAAGIPTYFEPEAFTTQEAGRGFEGERGGSTHAVDASAAALILTSYLGRTHGNN